ncbi:mitochondrial ribosome recycling factor 1 [Rhynchophorus ferrugineus]|uniref:mitochondrial ribosome recycling factor 1 n=1 Tax=Rhynchophorus ferrugineus TaxID=354439 RepID=UPI003FCD85C5
MIFCRFITPLSRYAKSNNIRNITNSLSSIYFGIGESNHKNYYSNLGVTKKPFFENSHTLANSVRYYAKGKNKKKEKGKTKVEINENQIGEYVNVESLKKQMVATISQLEEDFVKHLSLRSSAGAIESIQVNLDGNDHTLQELAQIVRKNPKTIVINFANFPQAIPAALKAIAKSGMNLNPQQDGTTLFIPVPKVTKEHREQLSKNAKQLFIKCRDSVKDTQQKYIKQLKQKDKVSEDIVRNVEQQIIAIADTFVAEAESLLNRKQSELLGEK